MGLLGLIFFKYTEAAGAKLQGLSALWFNGLLYVLGAGIIVGFIFYYNISLVTRLVERISFVKKYRFLIQKVEELRSKELTSVLLLSAYRFVVYAVQYICMMKAFGVEAGLAEAAAAVMVMNFILSILPSISIAELGIRGQVGLQVLGLVSTNLTGVLATSVTIWLVNLMLPALAGSIFILGIRLFKKN
jgi:hypothetical protein